MRISAKVYFIPRALRSRALLLALAASFIAPLAAQSPRNPLSEGLPDWLELRADWRLRAEGRGDEVFSPGADDGLGLSRFRLRLTAKPAKHVRFYVEGQDSRIGWREPGRLTTITDDPMDLRQAWVELGGEGAGPVRLRVGRQMIRLGGERLFGERRWNNLSPTWDAARLTLQHGQDQVDIFSMSMTDPDRGFNRSFPAEGDGNVHGFYGDIGSILPGASLQPYLFYVARPRVGPLNDFGPDAGAWSGGLRVAGELEGGWEYEAEWTQQRGHARRTALRGAMGAAQISYGAPRWPWEMRIHAEHEYASGDRDPADGRITTYDSLFTARRLHLGLVNMIGRRNIRAWQSGVETHPSRNLRFRVDLHGFWLASRRDALYSSNGEIAVAPPAGGAASAHAGEEIDFTVLWSPSPYWELDAGAMRFYSGDFLRETRGEAVAGTLLYLALTLKL